MTNDERIFYEVTTDSYHLRVSDHLEYGFSYERKEDYRKYLEKLVRRWGGRVGECVEDHYNSHLLYRLRFYDTPGGVIEEKWFPVSLLKQVPMPEYLKTNDSSSDELEAELDEAYEFD